MSRILLIADDDPCSITLRRLVLESRGYSVITVSSLEEAHSAIRNSKAPFSVALLDVDIGEGAALEIIDTIISLVEIPVVVLGRQLYLPNSLVSQAAGYVQKIDGPLKMLRAIAVAIENSTRRSILE